MLASSTLMYYVLNFISIRKINNRGFSCHLILHFKIDEESKSDEKNNSNGINSVILKYTQEYIKSYQELNF